MLSEQIIKSNNFKAKKCNIQLTTREVEIIKFINQFGFCEMNQLKQYFGLKAPHCYRTTRRLITSDLISHQFIFHRQPGVFQATSLGAHFPALPPLHKVPLATYRHQLKVVEVAVYLLHLYPNSTWISERQLAQDHYFKGFNAKGHVADGVLVLEDGKQICIEVELTLKSRNRLAQILKSYSTFFSVKEVWYVCPKQLAAILKPLMGKHSFVKVLTIESLG